MNSLLDVIVVGGGIAGMACALELAQQQGTRKVRVRIIAKEPVIGSNSYAAQGGMAAVLDPADSMAAHVRDTLTVGEGRNDLRVVRRVVREGPAMVHGLLAMGAVFDRNADGGVALAREGGHTTARVVHRLDRTGAEIVRVLHQHVRASSSISVIDEQAVDLLVDGGACIGVRTRDPRTGRWMDRIAHAVVLATGGTGQVYEHTTNPPGATGDGIAMAVRAGVPLKDMAFVQFHPTALYTDRPGTVFLISEAVRGAGARLLRPDGRPLMEGVHPQGDLAPRNVVARTIARVMLRGHVPNVWLDTSPIGIRRFARDFPSINTHCRELGIMPGRDRIPVMPAAHYLCGGIMTDAQGRTTMKGLYALGECACSGLHGADRLASNSLLEALVIPRHAAARILRARTKHATLTDHHSPDVSVADTVANDDHEAMLHGLRRTMTRHAGILRTTNGLHLALRRIEQAGLRTERAWAKGERAPGLIALRNAVAVSRSIVMAALSEPVSTGTHWIGRM